MDTTRISLLLRIRDRNDSAAWSQFDAIYRPMLRRFVRAAGLDRAATDDVVQDCMVAIHRHIDTFEYDPGRGRFKGWLRTLVRNRVTDYFRARRARQQTHELLDATPGEREPLPDEGFERVWRQEHVRYCLEAISAEVEPETMAAFRAVAIEQQPVEAVCHQLGMTPGQVHGIKWRVTGKLRERMRALLGEDY